MRHAQRRHSRELRKPDAQRRQYCIGALRLPVNACRSAEDDAEARGDSTATSGGVLPMSEPDAGRTRMTGLELWWLGQAGFRLRDADAATHVFLDPFVTRQDDRAWQAPVD